MSVENRNGVWYMRFQIAGRSYHRSTYLRATKSNLETARRIEIDERERIRLEVQFGMRQVRSTSLPDAADEYLRWVKSKHSDGTFSNYRCRLAHAIEFFGTTMLPQISAADLHRYKAWLMSKPAMSPGSVRHTLRTLSSLFEHGVRNRWCLDNPVDAVKLPPRPPGRTRILTADEDDRYFEAAKDPGRPAYIRAITMLMRFQGMRPEECCEIRKEHVDLRAGTLYIPMGKTRRATRELPLIDETRDVLRPFVETASEWLFPAPTNPGRPVKTANIPGPHHTIIAHAGLSYFPPYTFRHTFASGMHDAGVDDRTLAEILGHADTNTLSTYVHINAGRRKAAMQLYQNELRKRKR